MAAGKRKLAHSARARREVARPAAAAVRPRMLAPAPLRRGIDGEGVSGMRLAASEYGPLLASAPIVWLLLDANGVVVDANLAACRVLNGQREFLLGTPFRRWVTEDAQGGLAEHIRRCRSGESAVDSELHLRTPMAVRLLSRRVIVHGQALFSSVAIDMTDLEDTQRTLRASERRREQAETAARLARAAESAKDRLVATVSHELRNPLSPALMAASILASAHDLPDRARQMATVIQRNIEIEARLIDDLLDLARVTRGRLDLQMRLVDVHAVLHQAADASTALARAGGVSLVLDLQAARHHVCADGDRLQQVFWNLLTNAVKFSATGGTVIVRTSSDESEVVRITVRDFGLGMDADTVERLFNPFERPLAPAGRRAGLGLGLSIARGIVEAHGGHIWASSEGPGRGATFDVELATADAAAQPRDPVGDSAADPSPATRKPGAEGRVLLVEDHEDTLEVLSRFLSRLGFDVTGAATVADATAKLTEPWDIVLSDLGLPDGSGLTIARSIRAGAHQPRILVALSGYGTETDIAASRDAGFDVHLVKPVTLSHLADILGVTSD